MQIRANSVRRTQGESMVDGTGMRFLHASIDQLFDFAGTFGDEQTHAIVGMADGKPYLFIFDPGGVEPWEDPSSAITYNVRPVSDVFYNKASVRYVERLGYHEPSGERSATGIVVALDKDDNIVARYTIATMTKTRHP